MLSTGVEGKLTAPLSADDQDIHCYVRCEHLFSAIHETHLASRSRRQEKNAEGIEHDNEFKFENLPFIEPKIYKKNSYKSQSLYLYLSSIICLHIFVFCTFKLFFNCKKYFLTFTILSWSMKFYQQ